MQAPDRVASRSPSWWAIGHVGGSAAVALATFLPWLHSGERGMSVYDLRIAADRLELLDRPWIVAPVALVPMLLALGLLARWAGRPLAAQGVALVAASYTAVGAAAVRSSDLPAGGGTTLALAGAAVLLLSAVGELLWARRAGTRRSDQQVDALRLRTHTQDPRWANDGADR